MDGYCQYPVMWPLPCHVVTLEEYQKRYDEVATRFQCLKGCIEELHKQASDPTYKPVFPETDDGFLRDMLREYMTQEPVSEATVALERLGHTRGLPRTIDSMLSFLYKECFHLESFKLMPLMKLKKVNTKEFAEEAKRRALERMEDMEKKLEELRY